MVFELLFRLFTPWYKRRPHERNKANIARAARPTMKRRQNLSRLATLAAEKLNLGNQPEAL
jgi:hypothetical protein